MLVLHPLSHVRARASNMPLINARWSLISYSHKPVRAAVYLRRSATYKLDTRLIYASGGHCCLLAFADVRIQLDWLLHRHPSPRPPSNQECTDMPILSDTPIGAPSSSPPSSRWSGATCLQLYPWSSRVRSALVCSGGRALFHVISSALIC